MMTERLYAMAEAGSASLHDDNDCSVKALALVCGVPYHVAHQAMIEAGRTFQDGTPNYITRKALASLGFTVKRDIPRRRLELEFAFDGGRGRRHMTVADMHHDPEGWERFGPMMLFSPRHVSAFVNGKVEDWASDELRPIEHAWEIVPANAPLNAKEKPPGVIYIGTNDLQRRVVL